MDWKKVLLGVFVLGSLLVVSERLALTESCTGKSLSGACGTRKSAAKAEAKSRMSAAEAAAQAEAKDKNCKMSKGCTRDQDDCAETQASADCSGEEKACPYMSDEGVKAKGCRSEKVQGDVAEVKTEVSEIATVPAQE